MNTLYSPIKPKRVSEEIVEQVKALIFEGKLKPGESLPPERELAKALNVSRVSLREALNTLQGMGLLEIQQGNRTCVRPITTRSISDPLVSFAKSSPQNILKIFEIRKYLELGSVALAAERATDDEIRLLKEFFNEMKEDLKENRLGAKADHDFHTALSEATHNEAYIHLMKTIYDLLQEELRIAWGGIFRKMDKRKMLFEQHKNILDAVIQHDPERGREEALIHLRFVEENWKNSLSQS
ncbi:MAG: FadR/GntR family transcriptional regulator [Deltaproteobacteria bacterium]|nr:FadR/GntR family transcriptional regulator [Deltaproteobacteria bacterium]